MSEPIARADINVTEKEILTYIKSVLGERTKGKLSRLNIAKHFGYVTANGSKFSKCMKNIINSGAVRYIGRSTLSFDSIKAGKLIGEDVPIDESVKESNKKISEKKTENASEVHKLDIIDGYIIIDNKYFAAKNIYEKLEMNARDLYNILYKKQFKDNLVDVRVKDGRIKGGRIQCLSFSEAIKVLEHMTDLGKFDNSKIMSIHNFLNKLISMNETALEKENKSDLHVKKTLSSNKQPSDNNVEPKNQVTGEGTSLYSERDTYKESENEANDNGKAPGEGSLNPVDCKESMQDVLEKVGENDAYLSENLVPSPVDNKKLICEAIDELADGFKVFVKGYYDSINNQKMLIDKLINLKNTFNNLSK